jgi:hypothetical protein
LDPLKESALLEEELGFDASGTGGRERGLDDTGRGETDQDGSASVSKATDLSSLSNGIASLDIEHAGGNDLEHCNTQDLENLGEEDKISMLEAVFEGRVSRYTVQHTLKKCNWRWHAAMEELLNHVYLTEDSSDGKRVANKSIDAFSEENTHRRGRKGKTRQKGLRNRDLNSISSTPEGSPAPTANRWQTSHQDVDFIASRVSTPRAAITSIYNKNSGSLPKTVAAVLKIERKDDFGQDLTDPLMVANAFDLQSDFPSLSSSYINALILTTHPLLAAARELAEALTRPPSPPINGGIQIIPQYTKPNLAEFSDDDTPTSRPISSHGLSLADSTVLAQNYSASRLQALEQARAAHRRAKSNRLMAGAAAYYHQEAASFSSLSASAQATAASHLADSQSTATSVDLHGIDVQNGVRIAKQRVAAWWDGLGEGRVNGRIGAERRREGFRIVVGRGTHSVGGRGVLGPAVGKALREGGWRVEEEGASLVIRGRR